MKADMCCTVTWREDVCKQVDAAHLTIEGADRLAQPTLSGRQPRCNAAGVQRLSYLQCSRRAVTQHFLSSR